VFALALKARAGRRKPSSCDEMRLTLVEIRTSAWLLGMVADTEWVMMPIFSAGLSAHKRLLGPRTIAQRTARRTIIIRQPTPQEHRRTLICVIAHMRGWSTSTHGGDARLPCSLKKTVFGARELISGRVASPCLSTEQRVDPCGGFAETSEGGGGAQS